MFPGNLDKFKVLKLVISALFLEKMYKNVQFEKKDVRKIKETIMKLYICYNFSYRVTFNLK